MRLPSLECSSTGCASASAGRSQEHDVSRRDPEETVCRVHAGENDLVAVLATLSYGLKDGHLSVMFHSQTGNAGFLRKLSAILIGDVDMRPPGHVEFRKVHRGL